MACRSLLIRLSIIAFFFCAANALVSSDPKAILDLRETIIKGLGFRDVKVSGFDMRDALVGQSMAYEFDIDIDNQIFPVKLLEDVNTWSSVDLPFFMIEEGKDDQKGVIEKGTSQGGSRILPALPPFELTGPMEIWIQDGDDMRLSLPHDVDAGTLRKVLLSDGARVTVKGARSVSLRHPIELPLPLNRSSGNAAVASGLLTLAEALRLAASRSTKTEQQPIISLRIVGPTSLSSSENNSKLKLKRLAPGLVELSSRSSPVPVDELHASTSLWPLTSINGSNANLRGFEELLASLLGRKAEARGSFKLTKARVSTHTYMKMGFMVEKKIAETDMNWSNYPSWRIKPEKEMVHFEVVARIEDGKIVPERIVEVQPFQAVESVIDSVQNGNMTMSQVEVMYPPPDYFLL